ncbi:MAG: 3'-5' exonuclease [Bacteroidetes bacterium]|nr:MAG: 3'-5' exonuclease [Bacteroidota bacterium]
MLDQIDIARVLFLDIECVSGERAYDDLTDDFKKLWAIKARQIKRHSEALPEEEVAELYTEKAAIYAEFGKIICISVGFVTRRQSDGALSLRLKSFANRDEATLLKEFCELLNQYYNNPSNQYMCGHNIKEFDIPYICRRLVVHQMPFPKMLQIQGKKPWETKHLLDTMELWTFGDRKAYTSLKLLAAVLGFPSPKDDIDGSDVGRVFWEEDQLDRIALYCEKDVLATTQLFFKFKRLPPLEDDQITFIGR